jgi:hypothetical protein
MRNTRQSNIPIMTYNNDFLKAILNDIIINVYGKNPIILSNLWDDKEEKTILISCIFNMKIY